MQIYKEFFNEPRIFLTITMQGRSSRPALFVIYYLTFSLIYHIINQSFIKVGI